MSSVRPIKRAEERHDCKVHVTMPVSLRSRVEQAAQKRSVTLAQFARDALERAVEDVGLQVELLPCCGHVSRSGR